VNEDDATFCGLIIFRKGKKANTWKKTKVNPTTTLISISS